MSTALPDWLQFNVNSEAAVAAIQKLNTDPTNPHQPDTNELLERLSATGDHLVHPDAV